MTFREKLKMEHPDMLDPLCGGGCSGCPYTYGYESVTDRPCEGMSGSYTECSDCWDREIPEDAKDPVNHPGHYESGKFECIDVMLETQGKEAVMGFCICNAFKYLYRHNRKNGIEDVKKAQWYLNKYFELAEGG